MVAQVAHLVRKSKGASACSIAPYDGFATMKSPVRSRSRPPSSQQLLSFLHLSYLRGANDQIANIPGFVCVWVCGIWASLSPCRRLPLCKLARQRLERWTVAGNGIRHAPALQRGGGGARRGDLRCAAALLLHARDGD